MVILLMRDFTVAASVVLRWTGDHRVPGSNTPDAPFETLDFVRDLLFPLLKNSESAEVSLARSTRLLDSNGYFCHKSIRSTTLLMWIII